MEIVRLNKNDYDELIALLNGAFSRKNNREMDFEKDLPKMCVRDDKHMSNHLGIKEDGKLVAVIGIYPLPTVIGQEEVLFSTVGNIATHWDYTGKGYMSLLLDEAMKELEIIGADVSRLGGLRQRYARYGYESCGQNYHFTLTAHNVKNCFPYAGENVEFIQIEKTDKNALAFARALYEKSGIYLKRDGDDMYNCMVAWQNIPYLAVKNGEKEGYLCVNKAGNEISELYATTQEEYENVLVAWQRRVQASVVFHVPAYDINLIRTFSGICEGMYPSSASHFKIIHFEKVANALMKLKASYTPLQTGEFVMEIDGYGTIKLFVNERGVGCVKTQEKAQIKVSKAQASRLLFGPFAPQYTAEVPTIASAWFPLPLSWNLQNRV